MRMPEGDSFAHGVFANSRSTGSISSQSRRIWASTYSGEHCEVCTIRLHPPRGEACEVHDGLCSMWPLDLRPESSTYKKWVGAELTEENGRMLFVPEVRSWIPGARGQD